MENYRGESGPTTDQQVAGIAGLSLLRAAISQERAASIAEGLRSERWARWRHWRPFSRQDFGYAYDIKSRGVDAAASAAAAIREISRACQ